MKYERDEDVVFCPVDRSHVYRSNRGADGVILDRQTTKDKRGTRVKSVLVRWNTWRTGVSCFRIRGRKRAKSDRSTAIFDDRKFQDKKKVKQERGQIRFEESARDLHPLSYCHDCPLRLRRLLAPCDMSKEQAIQKYGPVED